MFDVRSMMSEGIRNGSSDIINLTSYITHFYSTVTLFARFRGLSTSQPRSTAM